MNISKPTFLINLNQCRKNIEKMAAKAREHNIIFRPHFKTHQSTRVGELYKQAGVSKITVSSVDMAQYFTAAGWQDITIAFPVNIREIDDINRLAAGINLNLLLLNEKAAESLDQKLQAKAGVYIEIDTGYHRSGILYSQIDQIQNLLTKITYSEQLKFKGFLTHAGHTYQAKSESEILQIHQETVERMQFLKATFYKYQPIISIGNTPSCSLADNFTGIDEIRPGNFVYYDLTQNNLGACRENDISVALACPVVAKYKDRHEIVVYGGGVHLSKEFLTIDGKKTYGKIVKIDDDGWSESLPGCYVKKLSQEHGTLYITDDYFDDFETGDIVGILPVHSCMTANLMKESELLI